MDLKPENYMVQSTILDEEADNVCLISNSPEEDSLDGSETKEEVEYHVPHSFIKTFFERIWDIKKNSLGFTDFLYQASLYTMKTVLVVFFLTMRTVVPVLMLVMGAKYYGQCPIQPFIPIYLIVGGVSGVLKNLMILINKSNNPAPDVDDSKICKCYGTYYNIFIVAWFCTGALWIYTVYKPNFDDPSNQFYCDKTLYLFAFSLLSTCLIIAWALCMILAFSIFFKIVRWEFFPVRRLF